MSMIPVPPLIPGSLNLKTLEVDTAKIESIIGGSLSSLSSWKGSVKVATTANIVLSGAQTVDGIALVAADTILVKNQTAGVENGLYTVSASAWDRSADLTAGSDASGMAVFINEGSTQADSIWVCTNDEATAVVGTDALVYAGLSAVVGAAGANTQVQYNSAGALAGSAGLVFNNATGTLSSINVGVSGNLLLAGSTSGSTTIQAAAVDGTSAALTLPAADGAANTVLKNNGSGVLSWAVDTVGSGDVVGPATSTANALATFDGATGKLLANSTIINAAGAVSGITNLTATGDITLGAPAGKMGFFGKAAIVAPSLIPLGAQTVDAAYNQVNLQTTINLIVADITAIITALDSLGIIN